jgi:hypothetical protein
MKKNADQNRCDECGKFNVEGTECEVCIELWGGNEPYKDENWLRKQMRAGHSYRKIADKADTTSSVIRRWRDKHGLSREEPITGGAGWDEHRKHMLEQYGLEDEI